MGEMTSFLTGRRALLIGAVVVVLVTVVVLLSGGSQTATDGQAQDAADASGEDSVSGAADSASDESGGRADDPQSEPSPPDGSAAGDEAAETEWERGDLAAVEIEELVVNDPIALGDVGDFGTGLTVEVLGIESVDGEANERFEVAGPALQVQLQVTNSTDGSVSLARTQVDVSYGEDRTPGLALSGPDLAAFPGSLAAGERATATVVFRVPVDQRDQVQIVVSHGTDAPVIVFEGAAT